MVADPDQLLSVDDLYMILVRLAISSAMACVFIEHRTTSAPQWSIFAVSSRVVRVASRGTTCFPLEEYQKRH